MHGDSEQVLSELLRSVERLQELLEEVLDQAGMEKMNQAQEVTDSLEAEIKELKKRDTEMKDLARCEDHIYYLQVGCTKEFRREGSQPTGFGLPTFWIGVKKHIYSCGNISIKTTCYPLHREIFKS